jgi:predicted DNA-binding transcriptional regulator AlpA
MAERRLPIGMTPRLLSRNEAATYCGMSPDEFGRRIATKVRPLDLGMRKLLWDRKALDRWLDELSGLVQPVRPFDEWLKRLPGDDRADQGH